MSELLYVGDSIKDGERAEECNVPFIAKIGLFFEPDFSDRFPNVICIEQLIELLVVFNLATMDSGADN